MEPPPASHKWSVPPLPDGTVLRKILQFSVVPDRNPGEWGSGKRATADIKQPNFGLSFSSHYQTSDFIFVKPELIGGRLF